MDESSKQLVAEVIHPLEVAPGKVRRQAAWFKKGWFRVTLSALPEGGHILTDLLRERKKPKGKKTRK
jgi:hypothetical protein